MNRDKMEDKTVLSIIGLICMTILELYAMYMGINGTYLSMVIGSICLIVGVVAKEKIIELKDKITK